MCDARIFFPLRTFDADGRKNAFSHLTRVQKRTKADSTCSGEKGSIRMITRETERMCVCVCVSEKREKVINKNVGFFFH